MKRITVIPWLSRLLVIVMVMVLLPITNVPARAEYPLQATDPFSAMSEKIVQLPDMDQLLPAINDSDEFIDEDLFDTNDPDIIERVRVDTEQAYRDAGYTNRYIVKYRPGQASSFEQKIWLMPHMTAPLEEAALSSQPYRDALSMIENGKGTNEYEPYTELLADDMRQQD